MVADLETQEEALKAKSELMVDTTKALKAKEVGGDEAWDLVISAEKPLLDFRFSELWRYRDLLTLFVRRDFVAQYKQTILGPLWLFISPILTTITFTIVFGRLAGIPTDGIPPMLFYLAGITLWGYFSDTLITTSGTFLANQGIFGKVYFPRLVVPLSIASSKLIKLGIQLLLFLVFYAYFLLQGTPLAINSYALLFPWLVILLAGLGLGFGMFVTSMTTKYRDLKFLISFAVKLGMYATPVIYPLSQVPEEYRWLAVLNPMTSVIETFKLGFLGRGTFEWSYLLYSSVFMIVIFLLGLLVFNRTERNFIDAI